MNQNLSINIKPTILQSEKRLAIASEFLEYGDKCMSKFEIAEFRYGIKPIEGIRIRVGRIYCIDIKSLNDEIVKLRLVSVYRIRKTALGKKYKVIVEAIFEKYFREIARLYLKQFSEQTEFNLLGNTFNKEGIILSNSKNLILWEELGSKSYLTYYSIFSKKNPNIYKSFSYISEWNVAVLQSVTNAILTSKNVR